MGKDYYKILGVPKTADDETLRKGVFVLTSVQEVRTEVASRPQ